MNVTRSLCAAALAYSGVLGATGCADNPTDVPPAASVQIGPDSASVSYADTLRVLAALVSARGDTLGSAGVAWTSSNTRIATVSKSGLVAGAWPGRVTIYARNGALVDSVRLLVNTRKFDASCPHVAYIPFASHSFLWATINPAGVINQSHLGETFTSRGTLIFFGAGAMFGTTPANLMIGRNSIYGRENFGGVVCNVAAVGGMHTVSLLQADRVNTAIGTPGLTVVQEQFALPYDASDDLILFRYTFTNDGTEPISSLYFGVAADFDVIVPSANVGNYDPSTGIADVVSKDSVSNRFMGGFTIIGVPVATYKATFPSTNGLSPNPMFGYLTAGFDGNNRSAVQDVHQILGSAPFDLPPGDSRVIWYVLATGENRAAFNANMGAARQLIPYLH